MQQCVVMETRATIHTEATNNQHVGEIHGTTVHTTNTHSNHRHGNTGHSNKVCTKRPSPLKRRKRSQHLEPLVSRNDCLKSLRELNSETARYSSLVLALGASHDNYSLRNELRRCGKKACDLARVNKAYLLPHLKIKQKHDVDVAEFEKLWMVYAACLELLHQLMTRTATITAVFPLHEEPLLIHTGTVESVVAGYRSNTATIHPMDYHAQDKAAYEWDQYLTLTRDVMELKALLVETQDIVDVKPWTIEPQMKFDARGSVCTSKSLDSVSDASSDLDSESVPQRRQRCVCLVSIILLSTVIIATILGVCVALLT